MLGTQIAHSVELGLLLLATCVIVGPRVAEWLRLPGLVGLIAVGAALGPSSLGWIRAEGFVATVGAAGLLYLMFLAGVELDLRTFVQNRNTALTFGVLTFVIPFGLAVAVGVLVLDLGAAPAALIGAMWASHTLIALPVAKDAGLGSTRSVGVSVAATVITDVLALVVLAVASAGASGEQSGGAAHHAPLPLWAGLPLLAVACLVVLPRATRWAFSSVVHSRTQRFAWLLAAMAGGGVVALAGGVEGLVGAFLAGIGVNRSVPTGSSLMEHLEFVGNAILIPAFLVSVGLSIDPAALMDPGTLGRAAVFVAVVVAGKTVAATAAGRLFGYSRRETGLMACLTIGQAAATLAIAKVGVATGLLSQEILDAAVVTVVVSVLITSIGTRWMARRLDSKGSDSPSLGARVLVLAPNPAEVEPVASLVAAIAEPDGGLVVPFVAETARAQLNPPGSVGAEKCLESFSDSLSHRGLDTQPVSRFGNSLADAAISLAHDQKSTLLVLPLDNAWGALSLNRDEQLDAIGAGTATVCAAVRIASERWQRIVVLTGAARTAGQRSDLDHVIDVANRVAGPHIPVVVFDGSNGGHREFGQAEVRSYSPRTGDVLAELGQDDLLVVPVSVVTDARLIDRSRLDRHLRGVSLIAVAGAGRLRTTGLRGLAPMAGAVGQRI